MGCGKSTAANLFKELGYRLVDSDALVREHILVQPEVRAEVRRAWGAEMLNDDGSIDRKRLAAKVFSDDEARIKLENWVHPRLYARWRELLRAEPDSNWVFEVPLLFEQRLENWFDFIVCVASSADVQLARLSKRGISHALAEQRISKQLPLARKIDSADRVLWNDGTLSALREQVEFLHAELSAGRNDA